MISIKSCKRFMVIPFNITTPGNFIAHLVIDGSCLLTNAQVWATEGNADVTDAIVLNVHNLFQLHPPVHHQATFAAAHAAYTPSAYGSLETHNACNSIGMGHAHQWTKKTMKASPMVIKAFADAIFEIWSYSVEVNMLLQSALLLYNRIHRVGFIAKAENDHDKKV
jgi:hypothetical protein